LQIIVEYAIKAAGAGTGQMPTISWQPGQPYLCGGVLTPVGSSQPAPRGEGTGQALPASSGQAPRVERVLPKAMPQGRAAPPPTQGPAQHIRRHPQPLSPNLIQKLCLHLRHPRGWTVRTDGWMAIYNIPLASLGWPKDPRICQQLLEAPLLHAPATLPNTQI